jgi:alpha-N-arabinofuranosidase
MYAAHRGRTAVRMHNTAEVISTGEESAEAARSRFRDRRPAQLRAVSGSASVGEDGLVVTLVNAAPHEPAEVELEVPDVALGEASLVTLAADDIHAHNTFEQPDAVTPAAAQTVAAAQGRLRLTLPAASVNKLTLSLG